MKNSLHVNHARDRHPKADALSRTRAFEALAHTYFSLRTNALTYVSLLDHMTMSPEARSLTCMNTALLIPEHTLVPNPFLMKSPTHTHSPTQIHSLASLYLPTHPSLFRYEPYPSKSFEYEQGGDSIETECTPSSSNSSTFTNMNRLFPLIYTFQVIHDLPPVHTHLCVNIFIVVHAYSISRLLLYTHPI